MSLRIVRVNNAKQESVVLEVTSPVSTGDYAIADNTFRGHALSNQHRHVYFFPQVNVVVGDVIYLHSGVGKDRVDRHANGRNSVYHFFDQGREFVWNNTGDKAILLHLTVLQSVDVGAR
jgi:hypothetical protein